MSESKCSICNQISQSFDLIGEIVVCNECMNYYKAAMISKIKIAIFWFFVGMICGLLIKP